MNRKEVTFTVTAEGYCMEAAVKRIGADLIVVVTGGDVPHVGTVTFFSKEVSAETYRFPSHHGRFHKDNVLAEEMAFFILPLLSGNCVITAGVHVDHISQRQIEVSGKMAQELGKQIAGWLRANPVVKQQPVYSTTFNK